jgi:tyrosyl-tRNA synthetase
MDEFFHEIQSKNLYGLTTPLLTTSSGAKMGKTAAGAVWLNYDQENPDYSKSPYDYWQFWRNTEDADVERFLKLFTELELEQIAELMHGNINDAKKTLATEATALLHGRTQAEKAAETARLTFEAGGMAAGLPEITVAKAELEAGIPAFKLLQMAGLAASGGEARRLIKGNGAKMNDQSFTAEDQAVTVKDLTDDGVIKLSAGKKRHILVRPN